MNVKIAGRGVVVVSTLKAKVIEKLQKFSKDSLFLYDAKGQPEFGIAVAKCGGIGKHGVTFDDVTPDGNACITVNIPTYVNTDKRAEYIQDSYGLALFNLGELEESAAAAYENLKGKFDAVADNISVD
jgi:hypothetical protein